MINNYQGYPNASEPYSTNSLSVYDLNQRNVFQNEPEQRPIDAMLALATNKILNDNRKSAEQRQYNEIINNGKELRGLYDELINITSSPRYDPDSVPKAIQQYDPSQPTNLREVDNQQTENTSAPQVNHTFNRAQIPVSRMAGTATGMGLNYAPLLQSRVSNKGLQNALRKTGYFVQPEEGLVRAIGKYGGKVAPRVAKAAPKLSNPIGWLALAADLGSGVTNLQDEKGNNIPTFANKLQNSVNRYVTDQAGDFAGGATSILTSLIGAPIDMVETAGRAAFTNEEIGFQSPF